MNGHGAVSDQQSNLERILERVPRNSRLVAETVATCAMAEFASQWGDAASDTAAVVCGRWVRRALGAAGETLRPADAHFIDRAVNASYCALTNEQIDATNHLFSERYKGS